MSRIAEPERQEDAPAPGIDNGPGPGSRAHETRLAQAVFMPSGRRGEFPVGTSVLTAARSLGVDIDSVCGGRAVCGRCQVILSTGEFAKLKIRSVPEHLTPFNDTERKYQRIKGLKSGRRLGCQAHLRGDVGTTTVAGHLCDLATGDVLASSGMMNPQIRFGEDLMSRISYLQQNEGQAPVLTAAVRQALRDVVGEVSAEAGVAADDIVEMTIVGNPTMHHLVLGIDPTQLGMEPFPLVVDAGVTVLARDLDLALNPGTHVYFLPCIAGHVGADTAGVILSQAPHASDEMTLVIDVGTNAELVLGSRDRLIACSSPTGPAFEGAQISSGQRAAPGAIERVRIDRATLQPRFKVIGCDLWSDDGGFAEGIANVGVTGICGSGIIEVVAELFLSGVIDATGRMLAKGRDTANHPHLLPKGRNFEYVLYRSGDRIIKVIPSDIRAIQLAKSACYSGARLLMDRMAVDKVDKVFLAGAFGSYIDVKYAMTLGMIPDCELDRVKSVGNAAGTGARIALLSRAAREEIETVIRRVEKVETAIAPRFQEYFVAAMNIPNAVDPFPNLARVVDLPAAAAK